MYEKASSIVRHGLLAIGDFLTLIQRRLASWIQGDDITVLVSLAFIALIVLFVLVPNRRRY